MIALAAAFSAFGWHFNSSSGLLNSNAITCFPWHPQTTSIHWTIDCNYVIHQRFLLRNRLWVLKTQVRADFLQTQDLFFLHSSKLSPFLTAPAFLRTAAYDEIFFSVHVEYTWNPTKVFSNWTLSTLNHDIPCSWHLFVDTWLIWRTDCWFPLEMELGLKDDGLRATPMLEKIRRGQISKPGVRKSCSFPAGVCYAMSSVRLFCIHNPIYGSETSEEDNLWLCIQHTCPLLQQVWTTSTLRS